jgi:phenylacetic acid degradation operon negative regulatory protein
MPERPLSARSVIASLLLAMTPPRLSSRNLVRAGELLGIEAGTVRVALTRMVSDGDLRAVDGDYELAGPLQARYQRQHNSRAPHLRPWSGEWIVAIVPKGRRGPDARSQLRVAARHLGLAEVREGVWMRPDNLDPDRLPADRATLARQCQILSAHPSDGAALAARLWDLAGWARQSHLLIHAMAPLAARLDAGNADALAPAFAVAASVMRHLVSDPVLPPFLVPNAWPGPELRARYNDYENANRRAWDCFLAHRERQTSSIT